jgi:hypothetical protein
MAKKARAADQPVPIGIRAHLARRGITSNIIAESIIGSLRTVGHLADQVAGQPLRDPIAYPDDIDDELRRFMGLPGVAVAVESAHYIQTYRAKQKELVDERNGRSLKTLRKGDV